jgi:hypothetical protein
MNPLNKGRILLAQFYIPKRRIVNLVTKIKMIHAFTKQSIPQSQEAQWLSYFILTEKVSKGASSLYLFHVDAELG